MNILVLNVTIHVELHPDRQPKELAQEVMADVHACHPLITHADADNLSVMPEA